MDGRSHTVKGDGSEKESQVRQLGTESTPWFGAGPCSAEHTHRHQTAVFRSRETCPEAGSKRALPSNKSGALPPETGLSVNNVRATGTLEAEDRPRRKSRRTLRIPREEASRRTYVRWTTGASQA